MHITNEPQIPRGYVLISEDGDGSNGSRLKLLGTPTPNSCLVTPSYLAVR